MKKIVVTLGTLAVFIFAGATESLAQQTQPSASANSTHIEPEQAKGLVKQFEIASRDLKLAAYAAYQDRFVARQEVANLPYDPNADADATAKQVQDIYKKVTPTGPASESTREKGKQAYKAWIVGKTPEQVAAAKKLYAAWLTMLDALQADRADPLGIDETPAGMAYRQAANEFNIDND